jgi:hypothetical protein
MRRFAVVLLFIVGSFAAQVALLLLAAGTNTEWLAWPAVPGLYSMRWLPNDPATAGSFIVFPTLAQSVLALAVNTGVYAIIYAGCRCVRRVFTMHPELQPGAADGRGDGH